MKTKRTACTRIELLVVVAVIVLLPAVITASLGTARHLAKIPLCANNLRQIGVAVYEYAQIFDRNLPNVMTPPPGTSEEMHPYTAYRNEHRAPVTDKLLPYRLACLYEAGLVEDPRVFYCPANTNPWFMFESYNNPQPWGTLPQLYNMENQMNQWVRVGYEWFPVDKNPDLQPFSVGWGLPPAPKHTCRRFDNLDPNLPYCTDIMRTRTWISHQYDEFTGLNTLYVSGRVVFCDDPNIFSDRIWDFDPSSGRYESMPIYYYKVLLLTGQLP